MTRRSKGMGLVEVIMAMTIATAMLGVLAATVTRMIRASAESQQHLQTVVTLGRLGEQFRRDVHESLSATAAEAGDGQPARLVLAGQADRAIAYEITPGGLERVVTAAGQPDQRDLFVLSGLKCLGWKFDSDRRDVSLVLGRLARPTTESDEVRSQFSLSASLAEPAPAAPGS